MNKNILLVVLFPLLAFLLLAALVSCGGAETKETHIPPAAETPAQTVPLTETPVTEEPSKAETQTNSPEEDENYEGLSFKIENGTATVWGGKKNVRDVVIPKTIAGYPVVEIAAKGFKNMSKMRTLVLPEGLLKIGEGAFQNCYNLTAVTLPESLLEIGESAFNNCRSVENLVIGHNLKVLPCDCFRGCEKLLRIDVPEGVEEIERAFGFSSTEAIEMTVTLPKTLKLLTGLGLDDNYGVLKVYVPDAETWLRLEHRIFMRTEQYAYENPDDPEGEWLLGTRDVYWPYPKVSSAQVFIGGELLTRAIYPEGITEIPDYCYEGVLSLTDAAIPESVTKIGNCAFQGTSISEIELPESVVSIGKQVFDNCPIEVLRIPGNVRSVGPISNMRLLSVLEIEEGVRSFGGVDNCASLMLLILPKGLLPNSDVLTYDKFVYRNLKDTENDRPPYPCSLVKNCPRLSDIRLPPDDPIFTLDDERKICYKITPEAVDNTI